MFSSKTGRAALVGMLSAGALALLWAACLAPSGRIGLTAAAGLFPVGAVLAAGRSAGFLCWAAASLLGLLILPDKGVAVLFLLFLGLYPVVKSRLESLRLRPAEWLCKLVYFNAALTLFWFVLRAMFLPSVPAWLEGKTWLLYLAGNAVFVVYDVGLSRLISLLSARKLFGRR